MGGDSRTQFEVPANAKFETKIDEGVPRSSGEKTYRAEIYLPRVGGTRPGLPATADTKQRTVCIRGPSRPDKQAAEEDARRLLEAAGEHGDVNKVRDVQKQMGKS